MSNGQETFLRVGIDGTQAPAGERVIVRSLDNISNAATNTINKVEDLKGRVGRVGDRADGSARVIKRSMNDIKESVEVAGVSVSTLENMFIRLAARTAMIAGIYGTLAALKNGIKESLRYLGQIESSQLGIASSFLVSGSYINTVTGKALEGQRALKAAQMDSAQVIEQLKVANFQTIASLDELVEAYQVTLPVAMGKGFNKKQVLDYTQAMVQAAGAIRLPFNQMAEETRSLLTDGAINPRNSRIATILGIRNEDIRQYKNDTQGLFTFLMGRLEGFRAAGIESQKTWAGLWSNVKDVAKQGGGIVMGGMFEGIKSTLTSIQNSIVTIDNETKKITWNPEFVQGAKELGSSVTTMFQGFVTGTKFVYEHIDALTTLISLYAVYGASKLAVLVTDKVSSRVAEINESRALSAAKLQEVATLAQSAQVTAAETQAKANLAVMEARVSAELVVSNALRVESLALLAAEKDANVASIAARQAELTLKQESRMATIADLEVKLAHEASVKRILTTGPNVAQMEKDLVTARRSLGATNYQLSQNETKLTVAKEISAAASQRLAIADGRQEILSAQHAANLGVRTAATAANVVAQEAATVATEAHSLALYKASLMGRAFTATMTAASSVLSFFGGWVGLIVTALGTLATAWFMYGNKAEEANKKALSDADDVLKSLRDQNSALEERNRLQGKSISGNGIQDPINGMSDNALKSIATYQLEINKLQEKFDSSIYSPSETDLKRVDELRIKIKDIVHESQKARFRKIEEASPEYKQNDPRRDSKGEEREMELQRKFGDSLTALTKSREAIRIAAVDENAKRELFILKDKHDQALMSTSDFYKKEAAIEKSAIQAKLDSENAKLETQGKNSVFSDGSVSGNVKQRTAYNIEAARYNEILANTGTLKAQLLAVDERLSVSESKSARETLKNANELNASIKEQNGATLEAINLRERYKQIELQKSIDSIKNQGAPTVANLKEIANLEKEMALSKGVQAKGTYAEVKARGELNIQLLRQAGLVGDAIALQENLRLADPGIAEADAFTQSLERMVAALDKVASAFDQLHRNDSIKFEIEDMGIDQYTKRERDIRREYNKTKEIKEGFLKEYSKDVIANGSKIAAVQEDLNLNEQRSAAQTAQLKIDMVQFYTSTAGQLMGDMANALDQTNRKQFEAAKALSIGQAIMNTASAVMQAMANMPPPASYVAAGVAIATGALQVSKIAATSYGGGGNVAGGAPSGSFGTGGGGTSAPGASIGQPLQSVRDRASENSLKMLAESAESASLAIGKVAEGLTEIADMFAEGTLASKGLNAVPNMYTGTASGDGQDSYGTKTWNTIRSGLGLNGFSGETFMNSIKGTLTAIPQAMFGWGNKWYTTGAGMELGLKGGAATGASYTQQKKDGGWFTRDKSRTNYSAMDPTFLEFINQQIEDIKSTIGRSAVAMGTFTNMGAVNIGGTKIATAGRSKEDIQKDLEKWFADTAGALAATMDGLKEFTYVGENAFDAAVRLATSLQDVNSNLSLIGHTLIDSTLKGANNAYRLQDAMGGAEKFTDKIENYFTSMFSESEQAVLRKKDSERQLTVSINEMNSVYSDLNWSVPQTREQFRALVDSLDLSTDKGMGLFAALMEAVPAMDDLITATEKFFDFAKTYKDWDVRSVQATGIVELAEVYALIVSQEDEIAQARKDGLNVSFLEVVQRQELNKYLKDAYTSAADNYKSAQEEFNQTIIDGSTKLLNEAKNMASNWTSIMDGLNKTRTSLLIGANSALSPEAQLATARASAMDLYNKGLGGDKDAMAGFGSSASAYIDLAKKYYASTTAFSDEFTMFNNMLTTAGDYSQQQVNYAEANVAAQQAIIDQLQQSEEQRQADAKEAAAIQMAQMKVLMEGFTKLLAESTNQTVVLEEIEKLSRNLAQSA